MRLTPGGGYVLGSAAPVVEGIPPQSFLAMIEAVHQYGSFADLGNAGPDPVVESPNLGLT